MGDKNKSGLSARNGLGD
jgi:hypothetical protein